jgi:hypothetical protein
LQSKQTIADNAAKLEDPGVDESITATMETKTESESDELKKPNFDLQDGRLRKDLIQFIHRLVRTGPTSNNIILLFFSFKNIVPQFGAHLVTVFWSIFFMISKHKLELPPQE